MKVRYDYLKDTSFLTKIDNSNLKEHYVKITLLNWDERPLQEIQGMVTGGTLNLDGKSSVRRTGSLSVVIKDKQDAKITNINNLFSINKKIYLEIGYKNTTSQYKHHDIIWFPQGVLVITGMSSSYSLSGINLNLQLKDKMCLLNGECGGIISSAVQFDEYETIDERGEYIIKKPTIVQIIRELVNHFGGEALGKIIISDIDTRIKTAMKWLGSNPVYAIYNNGNYTMTTDYSTAAAAESYVMYSYGEDVGFIYSDFTSPVEIIANAGDTVVTILDKIKSILGNFEYFYDIDGNFVFQEIKNYLNTSYAKVILDNLNNNDYILDMTKGKVKYDFMNSKLITGFSNAPQYARIKNDFVVWGIREGIEGISRPIRYHLAIDKKPSIGNIYEVFFYEDPDDKIIKAKCPIVFRNYAELSKNPGSEGVFYLTQEDNKIYKWNNQKYEELNVQLEKVKSTDWRTELYLQGVHAEPLGLDSNYYYTELLNEWPKLYDLKQSSYIDDKGNTIYTGGFYEEVLKNPSEIDYFLDFIDADSSISQISIDNIGRRTHVISSNDINCVFEPEIPDYVLIETGTEETEQKREECENRNQNYIQVDSYIYSMLALGGVSNSAYVKVREMLYQDTSYNENIQIQTLPIYYLEPNIRVAFRNEESDINGDYMINTISMPLMAGSISSVSATRALNQL